MTLPRSALVSVQSTPYYHCIGRCVRRAFLCGEDAYTGRGFEHRRGWIVERLALLSSVFAIDVAAYAVMSNHYHVILRINADLASSWSVDEVLRRWCHLFAGNPIVQRYLANPAMDAAELARVNEFVELYRSRLVDLSWFMRCLNEAIARMANEEAYRPCLTLTVHGSRSFGPANAAQFVPDKLVGRVGSSLRPCWMKRH